MPDDGGPRGRATGHDDRPVVVVLNRFDDEFGAYHRYVDHDRYRMAYISRADALGPLDVGRAVSLDVVADLELTTVLPLARAVRDRFGRLDGVIGVSEFDLSTAARLRDLLHVPGHGFEVVNRFRDKATMKQVVAAAGIRVPRFLEVGPATTACSVVAALGLPLILKPRSAAASTGVHAVADRGELARLLAAADPDDTECEEYVDGPIYHVDGLRRGGEFHYVSASAYVGTCLGFALGEPLGSYMLDPGPRHRALVAFTAACLDALDMYDGPFHFELIEDVRAGGELVFLEVGMRPGGGEIPFVHADCFGVDVIGEAIRSAIDLEPMRDRDAIPPLHGAGFVMVPQPRPLPCRVRARTSLVGTVPGVYREILPEPGTVFDGTGGYGNIGGRFHLRGADEAELRRGIDRVTAGYRLEAAPLDAAVATP